MDGRMDGWAGQDEVETGLRALLQGGVVQSADGRLPAVNRYLLLSGGVQQGTVDVDLGVPQHFAPGGDYDVDFTLLVPILHAAGVPVTLDMEQTLPGHARFSLRPFEATTLQRWSDCCPGDEAYLSAELVSAWFARSFSAAAKGARVKSRGCVTSAVVSVGHCRVLYDLVPVVAFRGWPEVARPWLTQAHFWDGKLRDEDVAGAFYLLPAASGGCSWRLAFATSELSLRKLLPQPLLRASWAATAVLGRLLPEGFGPYHLFTLVLRACERLPTSYLGREENAAHVWLGLLDDLLACLVHRHLPHYFLPQWNVLEGLSPRDAEHLARELVRVRADPSKHLRQAVEEAKEAKRLAKALRNQSSSAEGP
ncbi:transmembrane protein 102 isoform X2 [Paroedura picta]|uniref:transmembrane protein 102 isoform X2 n=1 Tax=Paroedura picta TaxID=143630 RepID=UPI0040573C7D